MVRQICNFEVTCKKRNLIFFMSMVLLLVSHTAIKLYSQDVNQDTNIAQEDLPAESIVQETNETESTSDSAVEETANITEKPLSLESQNVISSIKISTDRDLMLWLSNLGLDIQGERAEHEKRIRDYYGIAEDLPADVAEDKKPSQEKSEKVPADESTKEPVKESDKSNTETDTALDTNVQSEVDGTTKEDTQSTESDTATQKNTFVESNVFEDPIAEGETSEIVIENAQSAHYFTYEKVNEDVFTLKGDVKISVNQASKQKLHVITADTLIYNETLRLGSAVGNVYYRVYEYSGSEPPKTLPNNATEEFTGQVVSFNIDNFNSDMIRGSAFTKKETRYGKENELSEVLSFRIYAPHISKSTENVLELTNASFTSGGARPPIYRIRLKRLWILAPEEWAISRATIFLGNIPVIWFPFFVNPSDKFFFHPGIGYKTRGGGYFNTTTYIIGDATAAEDTAFLDIFNFSNQKSKKKIIKGLYLKEPEEGDIIYKYPSTWNLKYILDYYTTVGGYSSLSGNFPVWKFTKLSFVAGIAFSHAVFNFGESYFNYYVDKDGKVVKHLDQGVIYNIKVPFRYEFDFNTTLSFAGIYNTSIKFTQYSDSYFKRDFAQRVFDFDWQQILDPNKGTTDLNNRSSEISSYEWLWNHNLTVPVKKVLGDYMSSLSISNFRLKMNWNRKNVFSQYKPGAYTDRPAGSSLEQEIEGKFFYPSRVEVPSYQVTAAGTLFSIDSTDIDFRNGMESTIFFKDKNQDNLVEAKEDTSSEVDKPVEVKDEKVEEAGQEKVEEVKDEKVEEAEQEEVEEVKDEKVEEAEQEEDITNLPLQNPFNDNSITRDNTLDTTDTLQSNSDEILMPSETLKSPVAFDFNWKKINFDIKYNISHSLTEILYFQTSDWRRSEDIAFFSEDFVHYGEATTNNTVGLTNRVSFFDSMLSYSYGLTFSLRRRVLNNDKNLVGSTKTNKEKSAVNYTQEQLSNTNTVDIFPLKMFPIFAASKISYVANFDIGRDIFSTKEKVTWFEPDDKKWWNSHRFTQSYSVKYAGISNTLSLTAELPPRLEAYSLAYSLGIMSYLTFSLSTKIFKEDKNKEQYKYNPLVVSISSSFFDNKLSIKQQITHNYEQNFIKSTNTTFTAWWFSLNFTALREQAHDFSTSSFSFSKTGDAMLRASILNAAINYSTPGIYFWKNRVSIIFNINTNYNHDFLRFTNTKLALSYGVTFKIYQFLTLNFKTSVSNNLMFLYYEEYAKQAGVAKRDFWKDLGDSFAITDQKKLLNTAFKLNSLSLGFTQDFGGWVLNFTYTGAPKRETISNVVRFEWKNTLEISVLWKPISALKSSVYYRDDKLFLDKEKE